MTEQPILPDTILVSRRELMSRVRWLLPLERQCQLVGVSSFCATLQLGPPHWLWLDLVYKPRERLLYTFRDAQGRPRYAEFLYPGEVRVRLAGTGTIPRETARYEMPFSQLSEWLTTDAKGSTCIRFSETSDGHLTMEALTALGTWLTGVYLPYRLPACVDKEGGVGELLLEAPVRYLRKAMLQCAFNEVGRRGRHRRILGRTKVLENPGAPRSRRPVVLLAGNGPELHVTGENRELRPAVQAGVHVLSGLVRGVPLEGGGKYVLDARLLAHVLDGLAPEEGFHFVKCLYAGSTEEEGRFRVEVGKVASANVEVGLPLSYRQTVPAIGWPPLPDTVSAPTDLIVSVEALQTAMTELAMNIRAEKRGTPGSMLRAVTWRIQRDPPRAAAVQGGGYERDKLILESGVLLGARKKQDGTPLRRHRVRVERTIPAELFGATGAFSLRWSSLDDILLRLSAPRARFRFFPAEQFVEITGVGGGRKFPTFARWARVPLVAPRARRRPQ